MKEKRKPEARKHADVTEVNTVKRRISLWLFPAHLAFKLYLRSPGQDKLETVFTVNGKYGFEFILPRGPQIQLEGEVRWKKPKGDSALYGIYFSNIGVLARLRLTFFLHRTVVNIKKNMKGKGHEDA